MKGKLDPIDEYLKNNLDRLCNELLPSAVIEDIKNMECVKLEETRVAYGRFMDQFELGYDLIVKLTRYLNYVDRGWPTHRNAQFLLLVHNLKSLYSSFDRLVKGFYEDSLILIRAPYESIFKIVYITCYPNRPYLPIVERDDKGNKFNFTNFIRHQLKLDWDHYGLYSWLTHSNKYSVMKEAKSLFLKEKKDDVSLKFEHNEKFLQIGINSIQFVSWFYLKLTLVLFLTKDYNEQAKYLRIKAEEFEKLKAHAISRSPSVDWPKTMKDANDLLGMITRVEKGEEWKTVWKNIRSIN